MSQNTGFTLTKHSFIIILSASAGLPLKHRNTTNNSSISETIETVESCDLYYFVLEGLIGLLVCTVGLCGNFLSLLTIHTIGKSSVTFFLFRSLAFIDTVYLSTYTLVVVLSAHILYFDKLKTFYSVYQYMIYLLFPFSSMALTVTVWITVLLTIHRYIAVCRPLKVPQLSTLRGVKIQLCVLLVISYAVEIPRYFEEYIETFTYNGHTYFVQLFKDFATDDMYQLLYRTIFLPILRSLIPLLIVLVLTVRLIITVRSNKKNTNLLVAIEDPVYLQRRQRETITVVLIIIAVICIISHTPGVIYPIFRMIFESDSCDDFFYYFATFADLISALGSSLNFFVYYLLVPAFRNHLKKLFCGVTARRKVEPHRSASYKIDSVSPPLSTRFVSVSRQI